MKLLSTIKSIEIARKYQRKDGSWGNVYGIIFESGDDTIIAETFISDEGQKRRGIMVGAVGVARLSMSVRPWTDSKGVKHNAQDISLEEFTLANTNIKTETSPTTEDNSSVPTAQPATAEESAGEVPEQNNSKLPS